MQILFLFTLMTSNLYYLVLHHRNVKNHKDSLQDSEVCGTSSIEFGGGQDTGTNYIRCSLNSQHCKGDKLK